MGHRNTAGGISGSHDLRILDAIRRIIRAVDIDSRHLAAEHGITAPQLLTLMAVGEMAPVTAHEVAARVHISATTLVGVLDRLEAKKLIQRKRSAADRRAVEIATTAAGRRVVSRTPFPLQHVLERALNKVKPTAREAMAATLERLVELMEASDVDRRPMLEIHAAP